MTIEENKSKLRPDTLQFKYFQELEDCEWHCRTWVNAEINSRQSAGGGGIQEIQRETKKDLRYLSIQKEDITVLATKKPYTTEVKEHLCPLLRLRTYQ